MSPEFQRDATICQYRKQTVEILPGRFNFIYAIRDLVDNGNIKSDDNGKVKAVAKVFLQTSPAGNYLFKVNHRNTRTRCEICSKLKIKTPERSGVFIFNFEHISHLVLVFLWLTLNR